MFKFKKILHDRNKELKTREISEHYFSPCLHVGIRAIHLAKGYGVEANYYRQRVWKVNRELWTQIFNV